MMNRVVQHIRSNVVAYVALFVALGGTSYAALKLPANSVGTKQIKNHSITPIKLDPSKTGRGSSVLGDRSTSSSGTASRSSHRGRARGSPLGPVVRHRHRQLASADRVAIASSARRAEAASCSAFEDAVAERARFRAVLAFTPTGQPTTGLVYIAVLARSHRTGEQRRSSRSGCHSRGGGRDRWRSLHARRRTRPSSSAMSTETTLRRCLLASSGSAPPACCPGNPQGSPPSGGMEIYTVPNRTVQQGADVAYRVDAPAGHGHRRRVHPTHVVLSGSMTDPAGRETSSGQEDLAALPFSTKRPAGARPITGAPAFTWPASGTPYFGWQVACFSDDLHGRRRRMAQRRAARTQHGRNHRPNHQRQRRPLGNGQQLDPRQLAVGLRRRLALRRLQPQRLAERHQHPRDPARRGTPRSFISAPPRPCNRRSTRPSTATARCRSDSVHRMPPAWARAPGRPCTSTTSRSTSASAVRSMHP